MSVFKTEQFSTLLQDWGYNTVYSFLNRTFTCVVITILFTKCMYKYLAMISSLTKQLYFCDIASALVELSNTYTLYKCCGNYQYLYLLEEVLPIRVQTSATPLSKNKAFWEVPSIRHNF